MSTGDTESLLEKADEAPSTDAETDSEQETGAPSPVDRSTFRNRFRLADGRGLLTNVLAIGTVALALSGAPFALVALTGAVVLGLSVRPRGRVVARSIPTGGDVTARTLLALMLPLLGGLNGAAEAPLILASALLAVATVGELTVARVLRAAIPYAVNVPGLMVRNAPRIQRGWLFVANAVSLVALAALSLIADNWLLVAVPLPSLLLMVLMLADGVLRIRGRRVAERRLTPLLEAYGPVFAFHWDAPREESFQLSMWLPYLERLGVPFMVIVRNPKTFDFASQETTRPVLLRRELADLDAVVVPSLKTAFYVNNNTRNQHFVRYTQLKHIHLNHGESDKAPSYSPLFRLFDKNFVAGQAAIDRFAANGVWLHPDAFSIVGRPQVETIEVETQPISEAAVKTVIYAPTWSGFFADSRYSSLLVGYGIVQALLERGCVVMFRPHPYTEKSAAMAREAHRIRTLLQQDRTRTGRPHITGTADLPGATIADWFNAASALISDVSSVVPDFLYSEKPYAMTAMAGPVDTFAERFPISRGAYVIRPDLRNLEETLDRLLDSDPIREQRRALKKYYLGDFPHEGYADAFLDEARKYL
ncbi:CDP-glycerol glycerophosphotransferase family protein [Lysobacter korlensis]|uniref:CDP-glycerol glycerophosphotransferase family protein n=1 Tax=Lysobacter korlensis TaxID=553636 RepID=A0ABV6S113_9GAMM